MFRPRPLIGSFDINAKEPLLSYESPVVCCRYHHYWHRLWTALLVTGLIMEFHMLCIHAHMPLGNMTCILKMVAIFS